MPVFLFFNIQNRGCNPIKNLLQLYKINILYKLGELNNEKRGI